MPTASAATSRRSSRRRCAVGSRSGPSNAIHGTRATAARPAQTASPPRQEPVRSLSGTVRNDAPDSPIASAVVYSPVTRPIRAGKCRFTNDGTRTFAVAMPASAGTVAIRKSPDWSTIGRTASPVAVIAMDPASTRCSPTLRARAGATAPKPAKQSTGSVVSSPAAVGPMPSERRRSSRTGPMLTATGRRFNERASKATSSSDARGPDVAALLLVDGVSASARTAPSGCRTVGTDPCPGSRRATRAGTSGSRRSRRPRSRPGCTRPPTSPRPSGRTG